MDRGELEGRAESVLSDRGMDDPPVDALDLADLLELTIEYVPGNGARIDGSVIKLGTRTPERRVHFVVAHEIAHHILALLGPLNDEAHANYLGAALLVPRRALIRLLRRVGWDLDTLRCVHVNASAELLARRVIDVRPEGSMALYDFNRFRYRRGLSVHPRERELAAEAFATGLPVRLDSCTGAWPIFINGYQRVVVLAAA